MCHGENQLTPVLELACLPLGETFQKIKISYFLYKTISNVKWKKFGQENVGECDLIKMSKHNLA